MYTLYGLIMEFLISFLGHSYIIIIIITVTIITNCN